MIVYDSRESFVCFHFCLKMERMSLKRTKFFASDRCTHGGERNSKDCQKSETSIWQLLCRREMKCINRCSFSPHCIYYYKKYMKCSMILIPLFTLGLFREYLLYNQCNSLYIFSFYFFFYFDLLYELIFGVWPFIWFI